MKRVWLMGAVLAITGLAVACGDDSGDGSGTPDDTRTRVASALTAGISFENGTVELEDMPEATEDDLVVQQDDAPIELDPGVATLLPFEVENPDEDDPVVATLLQFEDTMQHVEVELELPDGGTTAEVELEVDDSICDDLCASNFAVKLIQSLKTRSGKIGRHVVRNLVLNCEDDGDEDICESADPGDGDGDGDGDTGGDGDGDTGGDGDGDTGGVDYADLLASGALQVNNALCMCMGLTVGTTACADARWMEPDELSCIQTAIETPANLTANVRLLAGNLNNRSYLTMVSSTCDRDAVFGIMLPAAMQELPTTVSACDLGGDTLTAPGDAGTP